MRSNREDPGPVYHRLVEEKMNYESIHIFRQQMKLPLPLAEGALIFDEVKVSSSIYWNAKSNKFNGHALSPEDMTSLHQDIDSNDKLVRQAMFCLRVCQVVFPGYSRFAPPTDWLVSI